MADQSSKENKNRLYFLVAGEESGDLHGSHLVRELKSFSPDAHFTGIGGDRMSAEGVKTLYHSNNLAMMGFSEVIKHIPFLRRVMRDAYAFIIKNKPHRVILIDYPGFNLRLARKLAKTGIPVTYFIMPQVWAWKEKRVELLRKYTDQLLSIMPFEQDWFAKRNVHVDFVGHPFVEELASSKGEYSIGGKEPRLLLLPGSRQQEIDRHWPTFLSAAEFLKSRYPELTIAVGRAPSVSLQPIPEWIRVEKGDIKSKMSAYTCSVIASGTATLEAAVSNLPAVVCYRLSRFSWWLAKKLVSVKYASIVNVIADDKVVPELLQNDMTSENIAKEIEALLGDTPERESMLRKYHFVHEKLGVPGVYRRAAELIIEK